MKFTLHLQDPMAPADQQLASVIGTICADGLIERLRLIFGFLTRRGLRVLLRDDAIQTAFATATVDILVGVDAVTDRAGLELLQELAKQNHRLRPRVLRRVPGSLFHTKLLVAHYQDGRSAIVVGSNNLTKEGLTTNIEAYGVTRFDATEQPDLSSLDGFIARWQHQISAIDSSALAAAEINSRRLLRMHNALTSQPAAPHVVVHSDGHLYDLPISEDLNSLGILDEKNILIRQVPKGSGRWSQIHYTRAIAETFFNYSTSNHVDRPRLYLRHFGSDIIEERVIVLSDINRNFKMELGAARNYLEYPANGRPLVVLQRESLAESTYRYLLLMPHNDGHEELTELANEKFTAASNQLPWAIVSLREVLEVWAACPLRLPG